MEVLGSAGAVIRDSRVEGSTGGDFTYGVLIEDGIASLEGSVIYSGDGADAAVGVAAIRSRLSVTGCIYMSNCQGTSARIYDNASIASEGNGTQSYGI